MQWIMNAYTIACTTVLMAAGTAGRPLWPQARLHRHHRAFGLTSLMCGIAHNVSVLIVSRFLQGLAGGAMLICVLAVLSHQFQDGASAAGLRASGAWSSAWASVSGRSSAAPSLRCRAGNGCSWSMCR
jgi:MFS family permease